MNKIILSVLLILINSLFLSADKFYDLKALGDKIPDTTVLKEYQIIERTERSKNYFILGLQEFNVRNYLAAKEKFWLALKDTPWE